MAGVTLSVTGFGKANLRTVGRNEGELSGRLNVEGGWEGHLGGDFRRAQACKIYSDRDKTPDACCLQD